MSKTLESWLLRVTVALLAVTALAGVVTMFAEGKTFVLVSVVCAVLLLVAVVLLSAVVAVREVRLFTGRRGRCPSV